ncbi:MAG TPA: hypothetical protein VGK67_00605 [Myxococcales bacterium]|jgi:hypothetical protein
MPTFEAVRSSVMTGLLSDRLQLIHEWYRGMVDPRGARFLYLYDPETDRRVAAGSAIREIATVWDVEVLGDFLDRDELAPVAERALAGCEALVAERGVADAFAVAAQSEDGGADSYRGHAQRALAFLLAAQRTAPECAPRERGGFGYSLENRTQRLDVTGHAASGFIKCVENGIVRPEKPLGPAAGVEPWRASP